MLVLRLSVLLIVLISLFCSQVGICFLSSSDKQLASALFTEDEMEKGEFEKSEKVSKNENGKLDLGISRSRVQIPMLVSVLSHGLWQEREPQSIDPSILHRPPEQAIQML